MYGKLDRIPCAEQAVFTGGRCKDSNLLPQNDDCNIIRFKWAKRLFFLTGQNCRKVEREYGREKTKTWMDSGSTGDVYSDGSAAGLR